MTTILGARSFEMGDSMLNTVDHYGASASSTHAKTGTYSLRIGAVPGAWARWAISGSPSTPSVSAWVYLAGQFNNNGTGTLRHNIRFRLTTGQYIDLRWNGATHTYDAYINGVLEQAGTIEVSVNTWFHVQAYVTIADAGNITVLVDGHESINKNCDTQPGVAAGCDYIYIHSGHDFGSYDYFDNLVWGYGGLLGDLRTYEKRPAADTALIEWTPTTPGSNWNMENQTPQNDASYNEADTDGLCDEFQLTALDITGTTCEAVIAWARARMTDGVGDSGDFGTNSNGVTSVARSALSTQWEYYWGPVEAVNPDGGGAWDQAALDALLSRKVAVIA